MQDRRSRSEPRSVVQCIARQGTADLRARNPIPPRGDLRPRRLRHLVARHFHHTPRPETVMRKSGSRLVGGTAATKSTPAAPAPTPAPTSATETKAEPATKAGSFVSHLLAKE